MVGGSKGASTGDTWMSNFTMGQLRHRETLRCIWGLGVVGGLVSLVEIRGDVLSKRAWVKIRGTVHFFIENVKVYDATNQRILNLYHKSVKVRGKLNRP